MSISPEFSPVPAFELLQAQYRPEEARKIYESMTEDEKRKTNYIMALLHKRKEAQFNSSNTVLDHSLPNSLVEKNFFITEKISDCLKYLSYKVRCINSPIAFGETTPVLILDW